MKERDGIMGEKTIENAFSMLIKFGSEENLKKLQQGELYMKNLQYYVDLEKTTDDEDVGDKYDGQMMLEKVKITMYDNETDDFCGQFDASEISMNLGYLDCPVFCMYILDYRNHTSEELNGDNLKVRYDFTEEQREKLSRFGTHALVIKNGDEFVRRVKDGLLSNNIGYTRDFVKYYSFNNLEQIREIQGDNSRIAFWKRQKYAYQQEYRFIAHTEVDDYLSVDIGDISDITELIEIDVLLNTYFEVGFKVKEIR